MELRLHPGWGLLVLRVAVGTIFLVHGWEKLFGRWGGGFAEFLLHYDLPAPGLVAPLVAALEFFGGLLLLVGFATRWVAPLLALEMIVAAAVVHLEHGFFVFRPYGQWGYEYHLVLLGALGCLFLAGGGLLSVDDWSGRRVGPVQADGEG
jgi:putative oxidoreductase